MTRHVTRMTIDDVDHYSDEERETIVKSYLPHERDARLKGVPTLGAGAIYPVLESDVTVAPFEIPAYWPKAYGLDVGWNRTAAIWGAFDRDTDTVYLFTEHYRGQAEPSIHAEAIKARGEWIPGVIDPASRGRAQGDGEQLLQTYKNLGLNVDTANNAVEAGIYEVWQRLSTGRLRVFSTCQNWFTEFRQYHRNDKGAIVKEHDHLMDATRYFIMSGLKRAIVKPVERASSRVGPADPMVGY